MRIFSLLTLTLVLASSAFQAAAQWRLQNDQSSISFVSTKNVHVSEQHSFTQLSGTLSKSGELAVAVSLESVETAIPIRNQRMQEHLFKVSETPQATLSATLSEQVMNLPAGESMVVDVDAQITIAGQSAPYTLIVSVFKNADGSMTAATVKPVLISASKHGLEDGINKLMELAGLDNIGFTVPVTFAVVFS